MRPDRIAGTAEAERLALEAFAYITADEDRLFRFIDMTGIRPDSIREVASQPGFLVAVLDHVLSEDEMVLGLAAQLGIKPERVAEARHRLQPPESFE
jgi:hypothetical protein